jgi:hypothetical protein
MYHRADQTAPATLALHLLGARDPARFVTLAPPVNDLLVSTRWDYRGEQVGVTVHAADPGGGSAFAYFSGFARDGSFLPALAQPTQLDLGSQPRACDANDRTSPRLVAPMVPGTRRPVLVTSSIESFILLTDYAVLHGTPERPCVSAWGAHVIPTGAMTAIVSGDLKRAWLFRGTPEVAGAIDVRPMQCHYAPGTPVPGVVWSQPGTSRSGP